MSAPDQDAAIAAAVAAAEKKAYARGYSAGRKRLKVDESADREWREKCAFRNKAFFAALPVCIEAQGWTKGANPIASLQDRTQLAWDFADEAVRTRRY